MRGRPDKSENIPTETAQVGKLHLHQPAAHLEGVTHDSVPDYPARARLQPITHR